MTVATTDGESIWAFRYSSEHDSRSLYFSTRMDALKSHYPEMVELGVLSDETRAIVSEPLGDLPGAWNEVPSPARRDRPARLRRPSPVHASRRLILKVARGEDVVAPRPAPPDSSAGASSYRATCSTQSTYV